MVAYFSGTPGIALLFVAVILAQPLYIVLGAAVLRLCGCPKKVVAAWALRQADRNRLLEVVRAARGGPKDEDAPP